MQSETHVAWPLPTTELKPALQLALGLAHADMAVLMLHDDTVGTLFPALGYGISEAQCELIGTHRLGVGPFGIALSEHRRVAVRDAWRHQESLGEAAHTLGFRGIEIVPLFGIEGQPVGALGIMYRHARGCSRRTVKLIEACAQLVVSAVLHARRQVEAERARESAEQVGRARIQFFARMSHELRTPLQSIAGYIDLLRVGSAEPLTPAQARLLGRVRDSEEILVHVIDDLITFSRLEAGHIVYHLGPVLAQEALRVTEAVVSPLASDRGVHLEIADTPPGIIVSADSDKLKQVLVNLAANAVKFTSRGGTVRLSCRNEPDGVSFDVADNGPGIDADKLREIFEPYVQLGTPLLDRFGGSGLGLAISREFATGMHGQLTVASTVGRGSVFTLRLPRATVEATVAETSSARPSRSAEQALPGTA
jgi:signal transduction histidine kinase